MLKTGVILAKEKNSFILMTSEGEILKINVKNKVQPKIGEIYTGETTKKSLFPLSFLLISAIMFLLIYLTIYYNNDHNTRYTVVLDFKTSIELNVSKYNKINNYKTLNNDGVTLLKAVSLKNKDIITGIESLLIEANKEGLLDNSKDKTMHIYVTSHKGLNISFSSLQNTANSIKINLLINDNGDEIQILAK